MGDKREPGAWRLEEAIRGLECWLDIGEVVTARKYVTIKRDLFRRSTNEELKAKFYTLAFQVEVASRFEQKLGKGSFLNTRHPYVQLSFKGESQAFGPDELLNAINAESQRSELSTLFNLR